MAFASKKAPDEIERGGYLWEEEVRQPHLVNKIRTIRKTIDHLPWCTMPKNISNLLKPRVPQPVASITNSSWLSPWNVRVAARTIWLENPQNVLMIK